MQWYAYCYHFTAFLKSLLDASFSTNNPVKRTQEEAAYIYFCDFIEECEGMLIL